MREFAGLEKDVVLAGAGNRIEVWSSEKWAAANDDENIEEICDMGALGNMIFKHKSVLLEETIDSLNIKPDGIYVDGTLGGGGHASEVCRRLGERGRL